MPEKPVVLLNDTMATLLAGKSALLARKHVVCEKPLTVSKKEAEELIELANKKNLVHATNLNVRFSPLVYKLKFTIQSEQFSNIFSINGSYLQDWLFYPTDYNWRLETEMSGESRAVADIGSHWMDMVEFVSGLKITAVMVDFATLNLVRKKSSRSIETFTGKLLATKEYDEIPVFTKDYATILFRFSNSARGSLTVSQVFAARKNCISLEVSGSKQLATWVSEKPNELWIWKRDSANSILMNDRSLLREQTKEIILFPGGHNEGFPKTFKQLYLKIYSKIVRSNDKTEFPTFESGLREIELCEKIVESNRKQICLKV
jgi:predicted dehydrogenase